jgi:hypothetical protein
MTDIPMMYTILLVMAGPILVFLAQGRTRAALVGSLVLWLVWQVSPDSGSFPWHIEGNTVFNIAAWQLLFVAGLAIGWHRSHLESLLSHMRRPLVFLALTIVSMTVVALTWRSSQFSRRCARTPL